MTVFEATTTDFFKLPLQHPYSQVPFAFRCFLVTVPKLELYHKIRQNKDIAVLLTILTS